MSAMGFITPLVRAWGRGFFTRGTLRRKEISNKIILNIDLRVFPYTIPLVSPSSERLIFACEGPSLCERIAPSPLRRVLCVQWGTGWQ